MGHISGSQTLLKAVKLVEERPKVDVRVTTDLSDRLLEPFLPLRRVAGRVLGDGQVGADGGGPVVALRGRGKAEVEGPGCLLGLVVGH